METSKYGSELTTTKTTTELTMEMQHKLRMIGVTIEGMYQILEYKISG